MKIEIDLKKSLHENASDYYEKAKKTKKKIPGLKKAIEKTKKQLEKQLKKEEPKTRTKKVTREKDWYEKFHWTKINDYLVIAGKDAKSNEQAVKKHLEDNDLYFHADIPGAASTILKDGQDAPQEIKEKTARFAGTYSKAFQRYATVDVYSVKPDQVKGYAKAGEYLAKGSFVITGKREYYKDSEIGIDVSFDGKRPITGINLKQKHVTVIPGDTKKSDLAKKIKKFLDENFETQVSLDEIMGFLPAGSGALK